ncbi:hypothetical protein KIPB_007455, partial [Kipferlia bialata]|eukprot:g7455.t1
MIGDSPKANDPGIYPSVSSDFSSQPFGVALTTTKITYVCSGNQDAQLDNKSETLFPELRPLYEEVSGLSNHIQTRTFHAETPCPYLFIDTPGTVDTQVSYGYDVDTAICSLASTCDVILVFLDPTGQALCQHTLDVIKRLSKDPDTYSRMVFVLSQIDLVQNAADLANLQVQVTQNLTTVVPTRDFELLTMVLPPFLETIDPKRREVTRELNRHSVIKARLNQELSQRDRNSASNFHSLVGRLETEAVAVISGGHPVKGRWRELPERWRRTLVGSVVLLCLLAAASLVFLSLRCLQATMGLLCLAAGGCSVLFYSYPPKHSAREVDVATELLAVIRDRVNPLAKQLVNDAKARGVQTTRRHIERRHSPDPTPYQSPIPGPTIPDVTEHNTRTNTDDTPTTTPTAPQPHIPAPGPVPEDEVGPRPVFANGDPITQQQVEKTPPENPFGDMTPSD